MNSLKDSNLQSLNNGIPGTIACGHFRDIDELAEFLPEDVQLTQLECKPFYCDSVTLHLEAIQFNFNYVNRRLHAVGQKRADLLTFSMILHGQGQHGIENNHLVNEDFIFGLDPNREANLIFPGDAIYCAVYIRPDVFDMCCQTMNRSELNKQFFAANYVHIPESFPPLRTYLKQLYALCSQQSSLLQRSDFQQIILQDFLPLLITALPMQQEKIPVKTFRRSHLVKQANDYMQSNIEQTLTLTDLCHALGTSSRALCYGFQEMFGMSPMAYLKLLRLQRVHRVLKNAEPSHKTVTEIASQFGFCHLGYFARDYRQVFGELPSETLKRIK